MEFCDRKDCDNLDCTKHHKIYGWICDECFNEFQDKRKFTLHTEVNEYLRQFMNSSKKTGFIVDKIKEYHKKRILWLRKTIRSINTHRMVRRFKRESAERQLIYDQLEYASSGHSYEDIPTNPYYENYRVLVKPKENIGGSSPFDGYVTPE